MIPLKNMRLYHNDIKRKYLVKYTKDLTLNLLDLATGKGGDLPKWKINKYIKYIMGFDINEESIKEAKKRLKILNIKNKKIIFKVKDLSKDILHCPFKYDIITSHFAFHYFFKNYNSLQTILKSINNCSKSGTILILSLFDGSKIKNINNENYSVKILDSDKKNYGKRVEVFIKDSVLNIPEIEYIVQPQFLINKLKSINFELIEQKNFKDIYTENFNLNETEKTLSFFNNIYIFKKK